MTVTLDLKPDLEQRVVAQAAAEGVSLESYLLSVIETAAVRNTTERPTLEEFEAAMDEIAEGTDHIPVLDPEAITRESIYGHRG